MPRRRRLGQTDKAPRRFFYSKIIPAIQFSLLRHYGTQGHKIALLTASCLVLLLLQQHEKIKLDIYIVNVRLPSSCTHIVLELHIENNTMRRLFRISEFERYEDHSRSIMVTITQMHSTHHYTSVEESCHVKDKQ